MERFSLVYIFLLFFLSVVLLSSRQACVVVLASLFLLLPLILLMQSLHSYQMTLPKAPLCLVIPLSTHLQWLPFSHSLMANTSLPSDSPSHAVHILSPCILALLLSPAFPNEEPLATFFSRRNPIHPSSPCHSSHSRPTLTVKPVCVCVGGGEYSRISDSVIHIVFVE